MRGRSYTEELKESIIKEVKEVGNISLVSRKHGISKSTITTLIRNSKEKDNIKVKPVKTPNKNAHVESFHRILEDDYFKSNEFYQLYSGEQLINVEVRV